MLFISLEKLTSVIPANYTAVRTELFIVSQNIKILSKHITTVDHYIHVYITYIYIRNTCIYKYTIL